jgi:hypothetical protein
MKCKLLPAAASTVCENPEDEWRSRNSRQSGANRGKTLKRTKPHESLNNKAFARSKDNLESGGKVVGLVAGHTLKEG